MEGLHLTADLSDCRCPPSLLTRAAALAHACRSATVDAGLTVVGEHWHTFPPYQDSPGGLTGMLLLAESHLAVHTWPERAGVTLDIYVRNFMDDNSHRAQAVMSALLDAFQPGQTVRQQLRRGTTAQAEYRGELLLEPLNAGSCLGFRFDQRLLSRRTRLQHLELLESPQLGRTLMLDGRFMTSEADEFFYHEALVHPAAITHPAPKKVLILGGGDGGAAEEVLKHPSVSEVTLVDIDADVVQVAREELAAIHRGALDDPRVRVLCQDGAAFVRATRERYDLVLLDLTDPETPAGPLYTPEFFEQIRGIFALGGMAVLHLGAPFHEGEQVSRLASALRETFLCVNAFGLHVPLYGAYWGFAVASDALEPVRMEPQEVRRRLDARRIGALQFYNPDVHRGLFALPKFYASMVNGQEHA